MSNVFLNVKRIGRLYLKETLVSYDHPLIFVCEDDYDSLYLFHEINDDEDEIEWQVVKITRQTYFDILSSKISLVHEFRREQSTPFLLIKYYYEDEHTEMYESFNLQCKEILELKETYLSDFENIKTGELDLGIQGDSSILELELYPGMAIDSINIDTQNKLCKNVKNIVKNMGENSRYLDVRVGQSKVASYSIPLVVTSSCAKTISAVDVTNDLAELIYKTDLSKVKEANRHQIFTSLKKIYEKAHIHTYPHVFTGFLLPAVGIFRSVAVGRGGKSRPQGEIQKQRRNARQRRRYPKGIPRRRFQQIAGNRLGQRRASGVPDIRRFGNRFQGSRQGDTARNGRQKGKRAD